MAVSYQNTPLRPARGIALGGGAMTGGTQARPKPLHMGATTVRKRAGGWTGKKAAPASSAVRHSARDSQRRSFSSNAGPRAPQVPKNQTSWAKPPAATPGLGPLNVYDQIYERSLTGLNANELSDISSLESRLPVLAKQYDLGYRDITDSLQRRTEGEEANLAGAGFFRSGTQNVEALQRAQDRARDVAGLQNQFGQYDANGVFVNDEITGQLAQLKRDYASQREALDMEKLARQYDEGGAAQLGAVSQPVTAVDKKYFPPGYTLGQKGWFRANGKWHFINQNGVVANNVAPPKQGSRVFG